MRNLALLLMLLMAGCVSNQDFVKAEDGTKIAYDYYEGGHNGIILIHGLDGDRTVWGPLMRRLEEADFSYVAIDLRGHGKSEGDWVEFENKDFAEMAYDVNVADRLLRSHGVIVRGLVGSSIGANLALKHATRRGTESVVLMSPGLNYRGVEISGEIQNYTGRVMAISSRGDSYAEGAMNMLKEHSNATAVWVSGNGHGTEILSETLSRITPFLEP